MDTNLRILRRRCCYKRCFYYHKKSKILHRSRLGSGVTSCKVSLNSNYVETERTFFFKYPKCMRCFTSDHNRLKSIDDVVGALDKASKRLKQSAV